MFLFLGRLLFARVGGKTDQWIKKAWPNMNFVWIAWKWPQHACICLHRPKNQPSEGNNICYLTFILNDQRLWGKRGTRSLLGFTLKNVSCLGGWNLKPSFTPSCLLRKDPVATRRDTHSIGIMSHCWEMKAVSLWRFTKAVLIPEKWQKHLKINFTLYRGLGWLLEDFRASLKAEIIISQGFEKTDYPIVRDK